MSRFKVIFISTLFFISTVRFWELGRVPEGFYSDEALYGYEAFSLLKTGKDQFGNGLPLSIAGFGDYRPALYIYTTIPFIQLFGLNEFAVRLPSALFSLLTAIVIYLLTKQIAKNRKIALIAMFLYGVSPWNLFFARMAHETNLMTLLISLGILCFVKFRENQRMLLISMVFFALSMYTYHTARLFVPLFFLLSWFTWRKTFQWSKHILLTAFLVLLLCLFPLIYELSNPEVWARVQGISFWSDPGVLPRINETRGRLNEIGLPYVVSKLIANKAVFYPFIFLQNYLIHFTPEFLFTSGDPNDIYNTPHTGILLWTELLFIIFGIIFVLKRNKLLGLWIVGGLLFSLVPDALTRVAPSSARIHLATLFTVILGAFGLYRVSRRRLFTAICLVLLTSASFGWFLYHYIVTRPIAHEIAWQVGTREMILESEQLAHNYEKVWISRSGWGWIHLVFHTRYDPAQFQKEVVVSEKNEAGFWWVSDVGTFHLDWLPKSLQRKQLYVATPKEFSGNVKPVERIKNSRGDDIYWLVEGTN